MSKSGANPSNEFGIAVGEVINPLKTRDFVRGF
jgi:hypothetical protein